MKNFRKAIRDSLYHWPAIGLATLCAVGVAFLWSANIGALWPVIEITLKGDSTQSWLQKSIVESEKTLITAKSRMDLISELEQDKIRQNTLSAEENLDIQTEKKSLNVQIDREESKLPWNRWMLSWAEAILPAKPFPTICCIMGLVMVSTLIKHILMLANDMLIAHVSTSIVRTLRMRVFARALEMDRRTYQAYGTSGLLANITYTADGLTAGLMNLFGTAIREPLRIVSCLILACYINWRLLLISILLAPLMIFIVSYFNRKIRAVSTAILSKNAGFHEVILEALGNVFTVQAFTMEKQEKTRFSECTKGMQSASKKMVFYTGLSRPFTEMIGVGMVAVTVCIGSYLVVNKATHISFIKFSNEPMTISSLFIFFGLLVGASDPLRKMSGVFTSIYIGAISADALYGVLESPQVLPESATPALLKGRHEMLTVENASFHYDSGLPILNAVNLNIPFGKTIAILGANGSGKSTLIQLLCRYYDPVQGAVKLDGIDYRELAIHDIRQRIAIVSQTTELFNRSVIENIQYGSPSSSREEAIEAAKLAHADEFITQSLSNGYDTIVGQGGQKLSGGQRQRIALARAILRNPEIMILDESTSQIDITSEILIRQTLESMKGRFTIVIITHREALLTIADDVYQIHNGIIAPTSLQAAA